MIYHAINGAWGRCFLNKKMVCGYPQTLLASFESDRMVLVFVIVIPRFLSGDEECVSFCHRYPLEQKGPEKSRLPEYQIRAGQ